MRTLLLMGLLLALIIGCGDKEKIVEIPGRVVYIPPIGDDEGKTDPELLEEAREGRLVLQAALIPGMHGNIRRLNSYNTGIAFANAYCQQWAAQRIGDPNALGFAFMFDRGRESERNFDRLVAGEGALIIPPNFFNREDAVSFKEFLLVPRSRPLMTPLEDNPHPHIWIGRRLPRSATDHEDLLDGNLGDNNTCQNFTTYLNNVLDEDGNSTGSITGYAYRPHDGSYTKVPCGRKGYIMCLREVR